MYNIKECCNISDEKYATLEIQLRVEILSLRMYALKIPPHLGFEPRTFAPNEDMVNALNDRSNWAAQLFKCNWLIVRYFVILRL